MEREEAYCLFLRMVVLRSSISSMGEEEESRELSEGLKEGELLSPCSTDRELGLSSRAWIRKKRQDEETGCRKQPFKVQKTERVARFPSVFSYHLALDQLLDGAHQLSGAGRL